MHTRNHNEEIERERDREIHRRIGRERWWEERKRRTERGGEEERGRREGCRYEGNQPSSFLGDLASTLMLEAYTCSFSTSWSLSSTPSQSTKKSYSDPGQDLEGRDSMWDMLMPNSWKIIIRD